MVYEVCVCNAETYKVYADNEEQAKVYAIDKFMDDDMFREFVEDFGIDENNITTKDCVIMWEEEA